VKSSSDERLPDRIAIGVLTRAFPPELVDEVVAGCGRVEQRQRLLPPRRLRSSPRVIKRKMRAHSAWGSA
jgi:hypothetical protein